MHLLQKLGNEAAHGEITDSERANTCIKILFQFCSHLAVSYSSDEIETPVFDESLIPNGTNVNETNKELELLMQKLEDQLKKETLETQKQELESLRKEPDLKSKKLAKRAESRLSKSNTSHNLFLSQSPENST